MRSIKQWATYYLHILQNALVRQRCCCLWPEGFIFKSQAHLSAFARSATAALPKTNHAGVNGDTFHNRYRRQETPLDPV